jgi:hypothetical protein
VVKIFAPWRPGVEKVFGWFVYLATKLLIDNRLCPAVFVLGNKSVNRSKYVPRSRYVIVADMP